MNLIFTEKPAYLHDIEGNTSEINFYDMGMQLTRRLRALKLYMSIKSFGLNVFAKAVTYHVELAEQIEELLRESPHWKVISLASRAVINFRYHPFALGWEEKDIGNLNQQITAKITISREAILVTTILKDQVKRKMSLMNPRTTIDEVVKTLSQDTLYVKPKTPVCV